MPEEQPQEETNQVQSKEKEQHEAYKKLMKQIEFFQPFDDTEIDKLFKYCSIRKYEAGEIITKENVEDYIFYVVLKGSVRITKVDLSHTKRHLATIKAGGCFGEMAILLHEKRTATASAENDCFIIEIDARMEELELEIQVKILRQFGIIVSKRLSDSNLR
ncbi:MAG: cyclic nucleotide-binding domain-containing protein [Nitrospinae bacterium]|nr:cyclic nucleotide-binding domain-containing protein [Nitrospinota bacterium]